MEKIKDFQEATYEYNSMMEMTNHIKVMGDGGWAVVAVNHMSLRAVYRKNLP